MQIKSNCTCGRFESFRKLDLEIYKGEDEKMRTKSFVRRIGSFSQINYCDGCGEKIWVEENKFPDEHFIFPEPLHDLEPDKEIPQDFEIKLNRLAINRLLQWVKDKQETHYGGD